jgi:hypothetical protein
MSYATIASLPLSVQTVKYGMEPNISIASAVVAERITVRDGVRTITAIGARSNSSRAKIKGFSLKRRLKGFISEAIGETWKAVFVVNKEEIPYELPAKELKQSGIKERYQPFEMDEFIPTIPGMIGKVYQFRPLAKSTAATLETLKLDSEQIRKRDLILARFKKA